MNNDEYIKKDDVFRFEVQDIELMPLLYYIRPIRAKKILGDLSLTLDSNAWSFQTDNFQVNLDKDKEPIKLKIQAHKVFSTWRQHVEIIKINVKKF